MPTPRPTPSPWAADARTLLQAAIDRDAQAMTDAARTLIEHHGIGVLPNVMLAWCDTAIAAAGIPADGGEPAMLLFADVDNGTTTLDAHNVRPEVAWAGRLVNARIADDEDSYQALMAAVPPGRDGLYVNTLLQCCALSIDLARKANR